MRLSAVECIVSADSTLCKMFGSCCGSILLILSIYVSTSLTFPFGLVTECPASMTVTDQICYNARQCQEGFICCRKDTQQLCAQPLVEGQADWLRPEMVEDE
uniref:Uncharacterized protein n=1 Tax=Timema shepardi TaxID=629360 RepID=A0A7R9B1Q4_TIMSH|nr:unnamed protein product [Timema shepardi]